MHKTEQEKFWAGEFGNDYIGRNQGADRVASNTSFFARILKSAQDVGSVIELGANIGLNLEALRKLLPKAELAAVEINQKAAEQLGRAIKGVQVYPVSILDFKCARTWDLALIKGVLIHINPDSLPQVYEALYLSSARYICIAEYYNPIPVSIPYRGHSDRLFKRDFAGEMLDRYKDLRLLDYGFSYHRDVHFPQDDITWFLLEKSANK
jgi:spore coat polysaccharide biosynthesis protein SpsF